MVLALGVGAYTAGFMHLVTHAAFKAGLFLGSGSVIFAMHHALHKLHDHSTDAQDVRNMGGLKSKMPVTYWTFFIFTLAIAGRAANLRIPEQRRNSGRYPGLQYP